MIGALASLAVVTFALRCQWLWQPERQLLLHQAETVGLDAHPR
jgi:hypothetical protein